jgi:tetratricopeptide (TPR) repeat protein
MAHYDLGLALRAVGKPDEAIAHYQRALLLDPEHALAHFHLGGALEAKGKLDEAITQYEHAVRLDPKGDYAPFAHRVLGDALSRKGQLDEAITQWEHAVRLDPKDILTWNKISNSLYAVACADLRAAADRGSEKGRLGESERADKRRQALVRLRASLGLRTKLLKERAEAYWSVPDWQRDAALVGVRDPAQLAKLPDAEREQWQQFWADVAAVIALEPMEQGRTSAARREWARAADGYARALKRGPTDDGHFWFEYAALLLLSGDRPGYAKACAHMTKALGKAQGPRSYHVARACTLAPDAVAEASLPGRLAEKELQDWAREFWSLTEQGALAYRAGRYQEAVPLFERSLKADATPGRAVVT